MVGPFAPDAVPSEIEKTIDLKASYPGKGGTKVSWRKLGADREGRIDLEAALGTRQAAAYLQAAVQSKAAQEGKLVLLLPADAKVTGWLNGKELKFTPVTAGNDPKAQPAQSADLPLTAGKSELLIKIVGSDKNPLTLTSTLVSPQGVEPAN